jgi:endonuclease YncB( thermonuclease family)
MEKDEARKTFVNNEWKEEKKEEKKMKTKLKKRKFWIFISATVFSGLLILSGHAMAQTRHGHGYVYPSRPSGPPRRSPQQIPTPGFYYNPARVRSLVIPRWESAEIYKAEIPEDACAAYEETEQGTEQCIAVGRTVYEDCPECLDYFQEEGRLIDTYFVVRQHGEIIRNVALLEEGEPVFEPEADFAGARSHKVIRIRDDGVIFVDRNKVAVPVRMIGVLPIVTEDMEKAGKELSPEALEFLRKILEGKKVFLRYDLALARTDRGGTVAAYVYRAPDGLFINAEFIRRGFGLADDRYPYRYHRYFSVAERDSYRDAKGVWSELKKAGPLPKLPVEPEGEPGEAG